MPCTTVSYEAMAEAGWPPEMIEQLRLEVELARREAEAKGYTEGQTLAQQQRSIAKAEADARAVAHDRFHAWLEQGMKEINMMTEFKRQNPDSHYTGAARERALDVVGEGGHRHLGRPKSLREGGDA